MKVVKKVTFDETLEIFTYNPFSKINDTPWFKKKCRILGFIKKFF